MIVYAPIFKELGKFKPDRLLGLVISYGDSDDRRRDSLTVFYVFKRRENLIYREEEDVIISRDLCNDWHTQLLFSHRERPSLPVLVVFWRQFPLGNMYLLALDAVVRHAFYQRSFSIP